MRIEKWYKSVVESNKENPPESVWEGVQDAIDIDMVWSRIETELGAKRQKNSFLPIAAAASVFLAIGVTGLLFFLTPTKELVPLAEQNTLLEEQTNLEIQKEDSKVLPPSIAGADISPARTIAPVGLPYAQTIEHQKEIEYELIASADNEQALALLPLAARSIPVQIANEKVLAVDAYQPLAKLDNSNPLLASVYIGLTGQLGNTWVLSSKTLSGLQSDEFTATSLTFGKNVGLQAGANLNSKWAMHTDFLWISQNRQQYNEYLNGKYVSSLMEFDYYTFTALAKYQFRPRHLLVTGGYLGLMQSANQIINGKFDALDDEYSRWDYGLILGYEHPIPLGSRFTISTGAFMKVGLNNIFTGNEIVPYYLNKTQNISFNLSLSVSYNIF
jgi:hypothetical protein